MGIRCIFRLSSVFASAFSSELAEMNSRFTLAMWRKHAFRKPRVVSLETLETRQLLTAHLLPSPLLESDTRFVASSSAADSAEATNPLVPLRESLRSVESTNAFEHGELTAAAVHVAERALVGAPTVSGLADNLTLQFQNRLPSNGALRSQLLVAPT